MIIRYLKNGKLTKKRDKKETEQQEGQEPQGEDPVTQGEDYEGKTGRS